MKSILSVMILLAAGAACGGSSGPYEASVPAPASSVPVPDAPVDPPPPEDPTPVDPDPTPADPVPSGPPTDISSGALQTTGERFVLERGEFGWETTIPYTYENPTEGPVFMTTCNGPHSPVLEKWDGSRWILGWHPIHLMCIGPPLRIEPGARHEDEMRVFAGYPGSNWHPRFESVVDNPEGIYRLIWEPRSSYQPQLPFGPLLPLEHRVSNPFELIEGD